MKTQKQKILEAFRKAPDNKLSASYLKRTLYISEANARISELRKEGYIFKDCGKDEHGFTIHQLIEDTSYFEKQKSEPLKIEFGNTKTLYELRKKR